MKVAVIGSNGQLGDDVVAAFLSEGHEVFALTHKDVEISDFDSTCQCLRALSPGVIVNTAAMHHVEKCESDPARAFAANAIGPRNLALVARDMEAVLMHVSTDYVFDGAKHT